MGKTSAKESLDSLYNYRQCTPNIALTPDTIPPSQIVLVVEQQIPFCRCLRGENPIQPPETGRLLPAAELTSPTIPRCPLHIGELRRPRGSA